MGNSWGGPRADLSPTSAPPMSLSRSPSQAARPCAYSRWTGAVQSLGHLRCPKGFYQRPPYKCHRPQRAMERALLDAGSHNPTKPAAVLAFMQTRKLWLREARRELMEECVSWGQCSLSVLWKHTPSPGPGCCTLAPSPAQTGLSCSSVCSQGQFNCRSLTAETSGSQLLNGGADQETGRPLSPRDHPNVISLGKFNRLSQTPAPAKSQPGPPPAATGAPNVLSELSALDNCKHSHRVTGDNIAVLGRIHKDW